MSKILLVEDNPDAVKRIIRYINKIFAELDVVSFPEAGDALQYAKANDISLFILDIQLEDYKGTNLAKQLRELPEYKYTPIIFETALAGEELSAYRDVKCYSFLVKPFGEEEFVTAFRDALGLSKQMSQQAKTIQIEQKQFILEYVTQDIAYIEAFGKKLVIHTSSRLSGIKEDNSLFTRYHKLPGILCFVTSVCRCPRSWHSITWSATLMSCCVLQFLM